MSQEKHREIDRLQMIGLLHNAEDGSTIPIMVTGMSMTPFLFHKQSIAFLKKDSQYQPKVGDIVFFVREDMAPVLHRIVKIKKDGILVIKGDAQRWREEIHPGQILAHVTHIIRTEEKFSVESKAYRFWVKVWKPFRLIHPPLAFVINVCHRLPYKLSRKSRKGDF
ncbi:MAG: S24/S26 family peptidase [Clostridia bacterium]|nr:S24/S26 family peptidase [Clostridia bacterium]